MKKFLWVMLLGLLIATPVSAYVIQKGDTPFGLWGNDWIEQMSAQIGHTDQYNLPEGAEVSLGGEDMLGIAPIDVIALYEDNLQNTITAADTTFTLVRGTDKSGTSISGTFGFIIDEGTTLEEFVIATCSGTSCTGALRGISVTDGKTEVTALKKAHRKGASVKMTNYPILGRLNSIVNGTDSTPGGLTFGTNTIDGATSLTGTYRINGTFDWLKYNTSTSMLQWSVNGSDYYNFTSSSITQLTASSTMATKVTDSQIGVIVSSTKGMYDGADGQGIYQKIKTSGGLVQDSNGLSITTTSLSNAEVATTTPTAGKIPVADGSGKLDDGWLKSIIIKSFTAGENITAGDAVSLAADTTYTMAGYYGEDFDAFVTVNNTDMKAQTFVSVGTKIKSVKLTMSGDVGAVNATVSIRSTTGGVPSGSDIEGKTSVMSITGQKDYIFVFSEPVNVISGQVYAIVVKASSSRNIGIKNSNVYSGGSYIYSSDGGSTWTSDSNKDFKFVVTGETEEGYIYKSNSTIDNFLSNNFIGFAYENITSTNSGLVTLSGLSNNHTGLTTGTTYYLSNTPGAISTSAGSVSRKVGLSTSATEILIKHDN